MERELINKVIVITGGTKGIGYAIADSFLRNGTKTTILLGTNETVGAQAAETLSGKYGDGKAIFIKCDVTKDLEDVSSEILQKYDVDVLVNNAGIADETSARRTLEVNTIAVVEWGMKFWEHMRMDTGGKGGTIFNMASIYGFVRDPWLVYYKTSKHGIIGFTKTLGHEYNYCKTGVRVIAICPGFVHTDMTDRPLKNTRLKDTPSTPFDYQQEDFVEFLKKEKFQSVEAVGKASVEIFQIADSGSAWVTKEDKPIELAPIT